MQYICDAGRLTWFRIETEPEAAAESKAMEHAVEKYFRQAQQLAVNSYVPPPTAASFEQKIGLKAHIQKSMPLFLTLRDNTGAPLVTAMLPPGGREDKAFRPIVVGKSNSDPYEAYSDAIKSLGAHFGMSLDAVRCFPYRR